jgi:CBS domain containing-hemolysin-like protein
LEDDIGSLPRAQGLHWLRLGSFIALLAFIAAVPLLLGQGDATALQEVGTASLADAAPSFTGEAVQTVAGKTLTPAVAAIVVLLLCCSGFFSGSETAFFSIHSLRLRAMAEEETLTGATVARLMENPSRLLTTILVGNMIVNVLIGVLLGTRVETMLTPHFEWEPAPYLLAVGITTAVLVTFGEILPKVFAVSTGEAFARAAVLPLLAADRVLAPVRDSLLQFTEFLFRVAHFHDFHAAPFITDEEFKSVLAQDDVNGVLEEDERLMIRGILEFRDALLREILVPRPDVVCLPDDATVADALEMLRENAYSRMPVYNDNLDNVSGILVAKDLMPSYAKGEMDQPVRKFVRPCHFVPETMTVQQFVNDARRHHAHMAIVVDEYGGTEGIVTLEDALEEVVGDILHEEEETEAELQRIDDRVYRVGGSANLDDLNEELGIELEDEAHETLAGYLMDQMEKVPEPGDEVTSADARFVVEACEGKRALTVRIELLSSELADAGEDE